MPDFKPVAFVLTAGLALALPGTARAQLPAFPGAQGFGAASTGGRGGVVYHVNSTANTSTGTYEGPDGYNRGTLRWCLTNTNSTAPRTIVFDISGQITLTSQITLEDSNVTIAGQTAPGQGFTSQGRMWFLETASNLTIRHMRFRLGRNGGQDALWVAGGNHVMIDHVSTSWSNDENLSVTENASMVTIQNSFITESLNHSAHGYGSLIRPSVNSKVSYHHNLYAHNNSRNPRPGNYNATTLDFDFRNNVIYNWVDRAGYSGGSEGTVLERVNMNFVGNYMIAGPATTNNQTYAFVVDKNGDMHAFQAGNFIDSDKDGTLDGTDTGWGMFRDLAGDNGTLTQLASQHPLATHPVTTHGATNAYNNVLDYAGAHWWARDTHDARVANHVRTQTGAIILHENDVGGFGTIPSVSRDANFDVDHDGMADAWEISRGLNPALSTDRNLDYDTDGYTNLEEYLNELGAWPAAEPIVWNGNNARFALNNQWNAYQPSRFDEARINAGIATVDARGQQVGKLRLGTSAGSGGTLNITSGWLDAQTDVVIGVHSTATSVLNLSGGELRTPIVSRGAAGAFNFTGGTLRANVVAFNLTNNGGKIAPGYTARLLFVDGTLSLDSGSLEVDLAGAARGTLYDAVDVAGNASLGGTLSIVLAPGYVPAYGVKHNVLHAASITGIFAPTPTIQLSPTKFLAVTYDADDVFITAALPGDVNLNGTVNFDDLLVLAANYNGSSKTWSHADFTGDGNVAFDDLLLLAANYNQSIPGAPEWAMAQASVPEPAGMMAMGMIALATTRRRARR